MFNTFVKQTEVNSGGGIRISVYKQTSGPDGHLVAEQPHQITVGPFDDFDATIETNNAHLQNMGYPAIDPAELALPIALRAAAHAHVGVQERMAIEAAKIAEENRVAEERERAAEAERARVAEMERIAAEERAAQAEADQKASEEADASRFEEAVEAAVAKLTAKKA